MKRTVATLIAAGLILPAGIFTASHLNAQTEPLTPESTLLAQTEEPGGAQRRGDRAERLIRDLNLTEDQATQIRAIREQTREEMRALHENLRAERMALHDLMAGDATEADLRAQHERVQALHLQVSDQRFETMLATRDVLTLEQRAELAELMEQRREQRRGNRGFRGERGSQQ